MNKIHIFIDGTWFFKVCGAGAALANTTDSPTYSFKLDWEKFDCAIKEHISEKSSEDLEFGEKYIVTSIFDLPPDFDDWSNRFLDVAEEQLKKTKKVVHAKTQFTNNALAQQYKDDAVLKPRIKKWIIQKLSDGSYQEKQVDTTVVALLVKSAIINPHDYHAVITGDADMLPAIKVAYPEYTNNVVMVTTHPDELDSDKQHSSFSYFDFDFKIEPFYLQQNSEKIIGGFAYKCVECGKVFSNQKEISKKYQPRCHEHRK
jgi:hypothetical protein